MGGIEGVEGREGGRVQLKREKLRNLISFVLDSTW